MYRLLEDNRFIICLTDIVSIGEGRIVPGDGAIYYETTFKILVYTPLIKEIVNAFRVHTIEREGYEADDLLGSIAKMAEEEDFDVLIVTGDKDMCQAVSPKVKLYDSMKEKITAEKDVIEK